MYWLGFRDVCRWFCLLVILDDGAATTVPTANTVRLNGCRGEMNERHASITRRSCVSGCSLLPSNGLSLQVLCAIKEAGVSIGTLVVTLDQQGCPFPSPASRGAHSHHQQGCPFPSPAGVPIPITSRGAHSLHHKPAVLGCLLSFLPHPSWTLLISHL